MEHKVYKIEHLDTGMKYIGYTSGTLAQRWHQHYNDPNSAVYQALRKEGHRMTMELMAAFDSKEHALGKESELIHVLNTMHPNGWNRKVAKRTENNAEKLKRYEDITVTSRISENGGLECPNCKCDNTHIDIVEVYTQRICAQVFPSSEVNVRRDATENPSTYEEGIRIYFTCECCHDTQNVDPPKYELLIYQHKGRTYFETLYYVESTS